MFKVLLIVCTFNLLAFDRVWFDYDLGFGKFAHDVDDAYALTHLLLNHKNYEIVGLSLVHGNTTDLDFQKKQTQLILNKLKMKISVFKGASSKEEITKITPAVLGLKNALEKGKLKVFSSGRLTNIATLVHFYPHLIKNISELVFLGGRRLEGVSKFKGKINFPDTNVDGDLAAIITILKSKVNLTLIPVESMHDLLWNSRVMDETSQINSYFKWLNKKSKLWKFLWNLWPRVDGFIPWDLFVITYETHKEDFFCEKNLYVDLKYLTNTSSHPLRADPEKKFFLTVSKKNQSLYKANYCSSIDSNHILNILKNWEKLR